MTPLMSTDRFSFVLTERLTILAVDDDPIQREFSAVYLATPTVDVVTADCAEAGLALLENQNFDLVLFDVEMPGMSGIEAVRQIRSNPRFDDLPIMVITSLEDIKSIDLAYEAGATAFMCKPVNWRLLSHHVKFLLRAHRAIRQQEGALA